MSLGNIGTSSLIKAAGNIAKQVADYNDKMAALQWNSSAQTDADWTAYSKYLQDRITNLNTAGNLTSASKALSLSGTLQSANRSYTSNVIQRQTIGILEGNLTATDKQNAIITMYQRAVENGDANLAQNLVQQYDSLNQQIQYDAQVASNAADSLAKADATARERGYDDAADAVKSALGQFGQGFSKEGQAHTTATLGAIAKALGIPAPKGAANNGSVIEAAFNMLGTLYGHAGDIAAAVPGGSASAQSYQNKIEDIMNGNTHLSFGGISFNYQDAQFYAQHPEALYQVTTGVGINGKPTYGLAKAAVNGYTYDKNGTLQPVFAKNSDSTYSLLDNGGKNGVKDDLSKIGGFNVREKDGQVYVKATSSGNNEFFRKAADKLGLDPQTEYVVHKTDNGYQFVANDGSGADRLFSLVKDNGNRFGLYEQTPGNGESNYKLVSAYKNFNQQDNQLTHSAMGRTLGGLFQNYGNLPSFYTEKTVIPQIAKQYFNGDVKAASQLVYQFRQPLELQQKAVKSGNFAVANPGKVSPQFQSSAAITQPKPAPKMPYKGNPDFRGYLAAVAPEFLPYVGNDGGVNMPKLNSAGGLDSKYAMKSLNTAGVVSTVKSLYSKYQSYNPNASVGPKLPLSILGH